MRLREIHFDPHLVRDSDILRKMESLTTINEKPTEEFWKEFKE